MKVNFEEVIIAVVAVGTMILFAMMLLYMPIVAKNRMVDTCLSKATTVEFVVACKELLK